MSKPGTNRKWLLLLGGVLVFLVVFGWLERLARPDPDPARAGDTPEGRAAWMPDPPEVTRLGDGGIEIRHAFIEDMTIRLEDEGKQQTFFDCASRRIDEVFADDTGEWDRGRVERESLEIRFECLRALREESDPSTPTDGGS